MAGGLRVVGQVGLGVLFGVLWLVTRGLYYAFKGGKRLLVELKRTYNDLQRW
jgi:hypothetical protein